MVSVRHPFWGIYEIGRLFAAHFIILQGDFRMRISTLIVAASLLIGVASSQAMAQGIIALTPDPVASGGLAPGSAIDYDFGDFRNIANPTLLTNFTVSTAGDRLYPGNGLYTTVIAPDGSGPFQTSIAYSAVQAIQTQVVATFSPKFDGDFTVWVLDANTDGIAVGNASVGLGVNGGGEVDTPTIYNGLNEFTPFQVTGATTSDVFQVYATTGTANFSSLGGLTFEAPAVPEPGSVALLIGMGLSGAGFLARRKRAIKAA
jgi:hypothetical protein